MKFIDFNRNNIETHLNQFYQNYDYINSKLNALVYQNQDFEIKDNLALSYIPVVLKDNFNLKGSLTTASSNILVNYRSVYDSTVAKLLKDNGALIIAKSSMDELGMGGTNLNALTGKVNNPYDLNRISGGSSGGSAVVVAADIVPLAIGSDTGDSVRKPAAYNGIVGFKPSYGLISRYGLIPYASSLDHVAYFNTNISDCAKTLEVLAQYDPKDHTSVKIKHPQYSNLTLQQDKIRIAVIKEIMESIENQVIVDKFNQFIKKLDSKLFEVEYVSFDKKLLRALLPTYYIIANAEASANHSNLDGVRFGNTVDGDSLEQMMINTRTNGFSSQVKKRFIIGSYSLHQENQERIFKKAQKVRRLIVEEYKKITDQFDAVLLVAAPSIAPIPSNASEDSIDENMSDNNLIAENHLLLGNFSGYPSITFPFDELDKMPLALNLSAAYLKDDQLLKIARELEKVTGLEGKVTKI